MTDEVKNAYSLYMEEHILHHFLGDSTITDSGKEHLVVCPPCKPNDRVCHINRAFDDIEPNFFFVRDVFFTTLGLRLPFTNFEVKCLNFVNVAPSQLYSNS